MTAEKHNIDIFEFNRCRKQKKEHNNFVDSSIIVLITRKKNIKMLPTKTVIQ